MIRQRDILIYIGENTPVPWGYIASYFECRLEHISQQMRRLRFQRLIKRVHTKDEGSLWMLTKDGQRRFEYYIEREGKEYPSRS